MNATDRTAALALAAERKLAYVVLPEPDGDRPLLLIPGAQDRSEYEFRLVTFQAATVRAVLAQALERVEHGQAILAFVASHVRTAVANGLAAARLLAEKPLARLDAEAAALKMAAAFMAGADRPIEVGASEYGASWGDAIASALESVKRAESWLLRAVATGTSAVAGVGDHFAGIDSETRAGLARRIASLEAAHYHEAE